MKKIVLSITSIFSMFLFSAIPCGATGILSASAGSVKKAVDFSSAWNSLAACTSAQIMLAVTAIALIVFIIFSRKLGRKLNNSSSASMMNAFLVFFSVFGIGCFIMAVISDGETWSHLMYHKPDAEYSLTQFSDYILSVQHAGRRDFIAIADRFTPMGIIIYTIIAQFLPPKLVMADSMLLYVKILRDQTFMYLYLILVVMCLILIYKMNRSVLRRNGLKIRDELVAFLAIVSYPTMYCVEQGNIAGIGVTLTLLFALFYDSKNQILRELSHVAIAFSAALNPVMVLFVALLFSNKKKRTKADIRKILLYTVISYAIPAFVTGFDCLALYAQSLFAITNDTFVAANMSIANLLIFFGINNVVILNIVSVVMNVIAAVCVFILPSAWQKMTAAIYIVLNIYSFSTPINLIFIFIPLVFLLSEKTHKASDWLYLLVFALLVTPFPEWFWFELEEFNKFMLEFNIRNIRNANNLISLASVQSLFILTVYSAVKALKNRKKVPATAQETTEITETA